MVEVAADQTDPSASTNSPVLSLLRDVDGMCIDRAVRFPPLERRIERWRRRDEDGTIERGKQRSRHLEKKKKHIQDLTLQNIGFFGRACRHLVVDNTFAALEFQVKM